MNTIDTELNTINSTRNLLFDIRRHYHELPDTIAAIAGLHAIRYDRTNNRTRRTGDTTITGGDALVMATPGTTDTPRLGRYETHIDPALLEAERHDPPSVLAALTTWEDAIRHHKGDPPAMTTTVNAAIDYLAQNTAWTIRHHPAADDYLTDLTALYARLRAVTGHTEAPKPSDAPCITCNGRIVQRYGPEGLDDIRECNRCGKTYTPAQYTLAVQQRLETVRDDPDRLLTAAEARTLWHLSEKQIYVWENRDGKIRHVARDDEGRKLYRNGDIAALKGARVA